MPHGGTKTVNREWRPRPWALAGWKGHITNLEAPTDE